MKLFLRFFIFFFFFLTAALLVADVPVRSEQFIYSILAFNGTDYAGTFCTEDSDTIYLIANVDNFISARKTLVYYWPITGDWKTDTSALNQPFDGTLELSGKDIEPEILAQTRYTYYNIQGEYELNWKVAKEEEAEEAEPPGDPGTETQDEKILRLVTGAEFDQTMGQPTIPCPGKKTKVGSNWCLQSCEGKQECKPWLKLNEEEDKK